MLFENAIYMIEALQLSNVCFRSCLDQTEIVIYAAPVLVRGIGIHIDMDEVHSP